jgi:hypothetical protein
MSKAFWGKVASTELERLRMSLQCHSGDPVVSLHDFTQHFKSIAVPPVCEWFDHAGMEHMRDEVLRGLVLSAEDSGAAGVDAQPAPNPPGPPNDADESMHDACRLLNREVSLQEILEAKEKVNRGKAAGFDGMPIECFLGLRDMNPESPTYRQLVSPLDSIIMYIFNTILRTGCYPESWRLAVLMPLLKGSKLDARDPSNYRGIALLACLSKLFANVLERRLTDFQWTCNLICDEQFGFTRSRRTIDPVFILDSLIDDAMARNEYLYAAFVDFKKAYDYVPLNALFVKMLRANMHGSVFRVLHSMYAAVRSVVLVGVSMSEVIEQFVGLRQGCILSPSLFSLFIADLPQYLRNLEGGQGVLECNEVMLHDTVVHVLMYADDLVLVARTPEALQRLLDRLREYCAIWH